MIVNYNTDIIMTEKLSYTVAIYSLTALLDWPLEMLSVMTLL